MKRKPAPKVYGNGQGPEVPYVSLETQMKHMYEPAVLAKWKALRKTDKRTPEEYWNEYYRVYALKDGRPDALYLRVCSDLGIRPKKANRVLSDRYV